ncbi:MAG TPA: AAA domain-containing protein [Candidatus Saccharimonadales bacterium]|nr:AAA domain-containing protein [Candidatus Saccharimonadales bacterium]
MTINSLDPSQKHALRSILKGEEELSVVYGPPGTGKSQLLVSMLFELAASGKKVLFVSQNTEALEVINRMILRLERDMRLPENHVSLMDFCLRLYTKEHKYLKYIRGQHGRMQARIVPKFTVPEAAIDNQAKYALQYVNLDGEENYNVNDGPIGLDELLSNYLKFVDAEFTSEPLKDFGSIDIRRIFALLNNYEDTVRFSFFNDPQNELRFISTTNPEVHLSEVQGHLEEISQLAVALGVDGVTASEDIDLRDFIRLTMSYRNLAQEFDLFRIQNNQLDIRKLHTALKEVTELSQNLVVDSQHILGLETIHEPIFSDESQRKYVDVAVVEQYRTALQLIVDSINQVTDYQPAITDAASIQLLFDLMHRLDLSGAESVLGGIQGVRRCGAEQLGKLIKATKEWDEKGKLFKMAHSVPDEFKAVLPNANKRAAELFHDNIRLFEFFVRTLRGTSLTVDGFMKIQDRAQAKRAAYNPFTTADDEDVIMLINKILVVESTARTYGLKAESIDALRTKAVNLLYDLTRYQALINANLALASTHTSEEVIDLINLTIRHNAALQGLQAAYEEYGRYVQVDSGVNQFIEVAPHKVELLAGAAKDIVAVVAHLKLPAETASSKVDTLARLLIKLDVVATQDLFSTIFHTIPAGGSLHAWYSATRNILNYQNVGDFDGYVRHHSFVNSLHQAVGANSAWIDTILADKTLDFEAFSSRVVNNLVRKSFQNMPPAERPYIRDGYFDKYDAELTKKRRDYYVAGLNKLMSITASEARRVANLNNWSTLPGSSMDKIRHSTELIRDAYPVIMATPKEVSKYIAPEKAVFDYILFDEASQLLPGQALPTMYRAKKVIIIGDPHQMPPSVMATIGGNASDEGFDEFDQSDSILDLAKDLTESQHHLKIHYRSESNTLFEPSRQAIYEDDGIKPIFEARMSGDAPLDISDNLGGGIDPTSGFDTNYAKITEKINSYLDKDPEATFCVLFTTMEEHNRFKDYLTVYEDVLERIYKLYADNKILISTVSNCQGIEGDYSILYIQHYDNPGRMWFFNETAGAYKRLNVSITRQRKGLSLLMADQRSNWLQVCDRYIDSPQTEPNKLRSAKLLRSLLKNAGQVVDVEYLDKELGSHAQNFDSPLTEELYKRLQRHYADKASDIRIYCEVGWHMLVPDVGNITKNQRNVGFRIDIGVYSMAQSRFVLGIEMDGAAYHSGFDKEHSDYERQRTLELKGWELYRIWSTNWLRDTNQEFDKLVQVIDGHLAAKE